MHILAPPNARPRQASEDASFAQRELELTQGKEPLRTSPAGRPADHTACMRAPSAILAHVRARARPQARTGVCKEAGPSSTTMKVTGGGHSANFRVGVSPEMVAIPCETRSSSGCPKLGKHQTHDQLWIGAQLFGALPALHTWRGL